MSGDDELERLLREVDQSLAGQSTPPARREAAQAPAKAERGRLSRSLRTGTVAGLVCGGAVGVATFLFSWLPFVDNPMSSGLGAFVGAFATGAVLTGLRD